MTPTAGEMWVGLLELLRELGRTSERAPLRKADLERRIFQGIGRAIRSTMRKRFSGDDLEERAGEVQQAFFSGFPPKRGGGEAWTRPPFENLLAFVLQEPVPGKIASFFQKCVLSICRRFEQDRQWMDYGLEGSIRKRLKRFAGATPKELEIVETTKTLRGRKTSFFLREGVPLAELQFDPAEELVRVGIGRLVARHPPGRRNRKVQDNSFLDPLLREIFLEPGFRLFAWSAGGLARQIQRHIDSGGGMLPLDQPLESDEAGGAVTLEHLIPDFDPSPCFQESEMGQWCDESLREFQSIGKWEVKGQVFLHFHAHETPGLVDIVPGLGIWRDVSEAEGLAITKFIEGRMEIAYGLVTNYHREVENFLRRRFLQLENGHGKGLRMFIEGLIGLLREPARGVRHEK